MRKYYYFSLCVKKRNFGYGVVYSESGSFPLFEVMKKLNGEYGESAISFWNEISYDEYGKLFRPDRKLTHK